MQSELKADRKYVIGTHPHGEYALGQLPFMFTSKHNPLFQVLGVPTHEPRHTHQRAYELDQSKIVECCEEAKLFDSFANGTCKCGASAQSNVQGQGQSKGRDPLLSAVPIT